MSYLTNELLLSRSAAEWRAETQMEGVTDRLIDSLLSSGEELFGNWRMKQNANETTLTHVTKRYDILLLFQAETHFNKPETNTWMIYCSDKKKTLSKEFRKI